MGFFDKLESIVNNGNNAATSTCNNLSHQNSDLTANYFPSELEKLISIVLADGKISEQGKQVLYKKAVSLGVDTDELDIVLAARIANANNISQESSNSSSSKHGELKKCPACGTPIASISIKCPDCGFEFQGLEANNTIQNLFEQLKQVDKVLPSKSSIGGLVNQLLAENLFSEKIIQRKKQIIQNFPIPTTRSDMLEFLSVAIPLAKEKKKGILKSVFTSEFDNVDSEHDFLVPVWRCKCEEIVIKAKIVMKNDPTMLQEILDIAKSIGIK